MSHMSGEQFRALMLECTPERLDGNMQRALLEHHCRELKGADCASDAIHWETDVAPCKAHCDDYMCQFRSQCEEIMRRDLAIEKLAAA